MKKNRKTDLLSAIIGILGCLMMAGVLMVTVHATKTNAEKNYVPEHDPRTEGVPDYVVWDSEAGEYVRKGYTAEEQAKEQLEADEFAEQHIDDPDPAEGTLEALRVSEDPIDRAAYIVAVYPSDNESLIYSYIPCRTNKAILAGVEAIPVSSLPALWERACTEPASRPLKLVALEKMLGIEIDDLGLFDPWAQEQWYIRFMERKNGLPKGEVTQDDAVRCGRLLLPMLEERLDNGTLTASEAEIMASLIGANGADEAALRTGLAENAELMDGIEWIISHDFEWTEPF